MSSRKLKPDKTAYLLTGSKVQHDNFSKCFQTRLLAQEVTPSPSARNLGIVFDSAVTKSPRFCHITPFLKSLPWLPVRYRIKFKLCSLTYQALTSGQPVYILNMLHPSRKVRTLCSSDLDQLHVPPVKIVVDSRAFSVAALRLWNELPLEIRSAKTQTILSGIN